MSRFLFSFMGGHGHFVPLVPVARAAQSAGHRVALACGGSQAAAVEAAGFEVIALGAKGREELKRTALRPLDAAREAEEFRDRFADGATRWKIPLFEEACKAWRPDVIVCDEADFGSLLVAERLGLPYASILVMAAGAFVRPTQITGVLNTIRAELGLPPDPDLTMLHRYLALSPFPPGFRDPAVVSPPTLHAYRPSTPTTGSEPPSWPGMRAGEPLLYFSLGTVFNVESGDLFERVLDGLSQLPANVLATVGNEIDPSELGHGPGHVHIERFVPQDEILPHAALVISHGGSGSVSGALVHGLPMLITPMGADQLDNAARVQALGIGRWHDPVSVTPAAVRDAAVTILSDSRYHNAAAVLRDEYAALPGADHALALIERLTQTRAPVVRPSSPIPFGTMSPQPLRRHPQ